MNQAKIGTELMRYNNIEVMTEFKQNSRREERITQNKVKYRIIRHHKSYDIKKILAKQALNKKRNKEENNQRKEKTTTHNHQRGKYSSLIIPRFPTPIFYWT